MVEIVLGFDFGIKRIGIAMGNTLTGQAQPLAVAIDRAGVEEIVGTIAGDDTIFVAPADHRRADAVAGRLMRLFALPTR